MQSVRASRAGAAAVIAGAFMALALTSCGGSGPTGSQGGELVFAATSFPDHLDPQLSSSVEAWQAEYNTYIPLLTFSHATGQEGSAVVPGLAKDVPTLSPDGKTYTLALQQGLKYSDGSAVMASDFQSTMQRLFDLNAAGSRLFAGIRGAAAYASGKAQTISGIQTDDATGAITIRLGSPDGQFASKLASPLAAMVPPSTPTKDQTSDPPPATGPYVISSSQPPHRFVLERNPVWANTNQGLIHDVPTPHADRITQNVVKSLSSEVTQVERNRADFMVDPPPENRLLELEWKYPNRFRKEITLSTYYFWMNTARPPFDDLKVRQAVNYAIDPAVLERIYGALMTPTQQVLPPGMPGYAKFTLYANDLGTARQLIREASPSDKKVTVRTDDQRPDERAGLYLRSVLRKLGFQADLKVVNRKAYYRTVGNAKTPNLDAGFASWTPQLPRPNDFFGTLLSGDAIRRTGNSNLAQFDDPAVNQEIARLAAQPLDSTAEDAYKALDQRVMEQAPWAPFGNREVATVTSDQINIDSVIFNPVMHQDYGSFALK
jgi:peptide/nickel transport system substrate-binding protein